VGGEIMEHDFPEADWKLFRKLRGPALERFCQRVLDEIEAIRADGSRSHHERYRAVFTLLRKRDEQIARAFDDPRRSQMVVQLANIFALDLLVPEELERFTAQTRARIEFMTKERTR
jgi:hypothetical protein